MRRATRFAVQVEFDNATSERSGSASRKDAGHGHGGIRCQRAIGGRWGIANSLHRGLDLALREDASTVRSGQAATNPATLRRLALNLLRQGYERGVRTKPRIAA